MTNHNHPSTEGDVDQATALIQRARGGEKQALNELIETWRTYLLFVANAELDAELKPKLGASDLVQSACVDIHKHFHEFRGDTVAEWKAWLRQLLLRDVQDVRRRFREAGKRDLNREQQFADGEGFQFDPAGEDLSPSASLIAWEETEALREALARLSDEHRLVIRLRNWDDLPFAEVGKRLNRSEDVARKLWSRAVKKLQVELERMEHEA